MQRLPGQPSTKKQSSKIHALEAGRAIAALMVVVFHARQQAIPRAYDGADSWDGLAMGRAGVEFFFVLSGFIMFYVHRAQFGQGSGCSDFLYRRFVRIFPLYWLVLLPLIGSYLLLGQGPGHARDLFVAVAQSALLPVGDHMILTVAWTLSHEMLFYLVFSTLFLSLTLGVVVLAAWFSSCAFFFLTGLSPGPLGFLFSHYNLLFFFGMAAAAAHMSISSRAAPVLVCIGAALFVAAGLSDALRWHDWKPEVLTIAFGLSAMVLVAALAACNGPTAPRFVVLLGAASYAIYLVHYPVINFTGRLLEATGLNQVVPPTAALSLVIAIGTAAGIVLHQIVEKPLLRNLRDRRRISSAVRR